MNELPGARARVALFGLTTIAEYHRDGDGQGKGRDILFFVDNIFRFNSRQVPRSIGSVGTYAFCRGYQPTLVTEMGLDGDHFNTQ